jgi:hypothetical protein
MRRDIRDFLSARVTECAILVALIGCGEETAATTTGAGGGGPCLPCNDFASNIASPGSVCAGAPDDAAEALIVCMCEDCAECLDNVCQNIPHSDACLACRDATCASQVAECQAN